MCSSTPAMGKAGKAPAAKHSHVMLSSAHIPGHKIGCGFEAPNSEGKVRSIRHVSLNTVESWARGNRRGLSPSMELVGASP